MWINLFRAEWGKITGNRWVVMGLIWIFPIIAVLFLSFALLAAILSESFRQGVQGDPAMWTELAIFPWVIPTNPLGRGLLLGFTAVLFAGEYQWNTWKMIVPRSKRVPLILIKFLAVAVFIVFAFTLMSIILTFGMGLISWVAGATYGPELTSDVLRDFTEDYVLQMGQTFTATIIAAGYASLAAMVTRSILGSVIASIVMTIAEGLLILPLYLMSYFLGTDIPLHVYRFLPTYNLLNIFTWLVGDTPEGITFPSEATVVDSLSFSGAVLACWVVGLIGLTAYLFYKQDITN